jgi:large subunit ribosomal protein L15
MIHDITARAPRLKRSQRKGRGESSGRGKTSGRGTKGSGAHGGDIHWKPGHEGGQTPIHRRLPKRGFSNDNFERRFHIVNISELEKFDAGATVDAEALRQRGLVPDLKLPVKILGEGKLTKKLNVTAGWYSKSAHEQITAAGGTALNLQAEPFVFPKAKRRFPKQYGEAAKKGGKKKAPAAEAPSETAAAQPAPPETPRSE